MNISELVKTIRNLKLEISVEYFKDEQMLDKRAVGCGVYIIELSYKSSSIQSTPLYIGESVYMVKRGGEHLFEFFKNPAYLGFSSEDDIKDSNLVISFRVLEECDYSELKKKEMKLINELNPILQKQNSDKMLEPDEKIEKVSNVLRKYRSVKARF